ncbi:MAG: preprotein translocase subunit SecA [Parachlamydiales bacterium]|nr:preprotein translocase subunit SecA [Parachlamydiales bacterium]
MFGLLKKIFGTQQGRILKKYRATVVAINKQEEAYQALSEEAIIQKTVEFKKRYTEGESLDDLLVEAYALVKNVCRRLIGTEIHVSGYHQKWDMIPYDVQMLGAIAMHYGAIAEMQTGEGKTLTAAMPLYLNALSGEGSHLVTANDYLAQRDCEWIGTIFLKLGLKVASLTNDTPLHLRQEVYQSDIVYGTASEFGFDYLRDNSMASRKEEQVQRPLHFAIIDEVDSILIDEARTPLIISGPSPVSNQMYDELKSGVAALVKAQRNLCARLATEGHSILQGLGLLQETKPDKLSKQDLEKREEAFKKLWLVTKGTPRNKILKRIQEDPDLRAELDHLETYFYSEQNKKEKSTMLAGLYIIVDEKSNEYELTDKGIQEWAEINHDEKSAFDFVMLDLGYEYAQIDLEAALTDSEKMQKKMDLRQEDAKRKERAHNLRQLFRAHLLMEKDVDYIVDQQKIIIIDENTGRPQPGRRFSDGLHQAIEAKESVIIQGETQTYATITLQNFFRMYKKIAGMTGTAITEANEFKEIYQLTVVEIPTYRSCQRIDHDDEIYMTEREKYIAILQEIKKAHQRGQPILIGTESVEISEKLSRILRQNNLIHVVLNAKNHANEAEIIAAAGKEGAITIATNMAGRGTDIKLHPIAKEAGGLHVIGSTRHHSRRIDRQLRGRSGRLGDPGSSKFFVSFEDSLLRLFASPRLTAMLQRFRPPEGEPISAKVLNKSIETAQKRIEQRNYTIRKHTLEYDNVMNTQRKEIYSFRNDLIHAENPLILAKTVIENTIIDQMFCFNEKGQSDPAVFRQWLQSHFPVTISSEEFHDYLSQEELEKQSLEKVILAFDAKIEHQKKMLLPFVQEKNEEAVHQLLWNILRAIMVQKIDQLWQAHLLEIDHLRSDVNLRVVGQKDPLLEFKHEAFQLFHTFSQKLHLEISSELFRFEMVLPHKKLEDTIAQLQMDTQRSFLPQPQESSTPSEEEPVASSPITNEAKIGRNDTCPCGSGKKYKKCCGKNVQVP